MSSTKSRTISAELQQSLVDDAAGPRRRRRPLGTRESESWYAGELEFNRIWNAQEDGEVSETFTSIHNTLAVVCALVLAFTYSVNGGRLEDAGENITIWHPDWVSHAQDVYGLLMLFVSLLSIGAIMICVQNIAVVAEVPKSRARAFVIKMGPHMYQIMWGFVYALLLIFTASTILQASLLYRPWVFITLTIASVAVWLGVFTLNVKKIHMRNQILRDFLAERDANGDVHIANPAAGAAILSRSS